MGVVKCSFFVSLSLFSQKALHVLRSAGWPRVLPHHHVDTGAVAGGRRARTRCQPLNMHFYSTKVLHIRKTHSTHLVSHLPPSCGFPLTDRNPLNPQHIVLSHTQSTSTPFPLNSFLAISISLSRLCCASGASLKNSRFQPMEDRR